MHRVVVHRWVWVALALTLGTAQAQTTPNPMPQTQVSPTPAMGDDLALEAVQKLNATACQSFIDAEVNEKPLASSELPAMLQEDIRNRLRELSLTVSVKADGLAECQSFVVKNDSPCMSLPTTERQQRCKASVSKIRETWKDPPEKIVRSTYATSLYDLCKGGQSEKECRAAERGVRDGNAKACAEISSPEMKGMCTAWSLGDPTKCDAKLGIDCTKGSTAIRNVVKEGLAAVPFPNPESRLLTQIVLGKTKAGCDTLVEVIKKDCAEKITQVQRARATMAMWTPTPGPPPTENSAPEMSPAGATPSVSK